MFGKLSALMELMRVGNEIKGAAAWKNAQMLASFIGALYMVAKAFDVPLPAITDDQIGTLGAATALVFNILLTVITSAKVGILPAKPDSNS